MFDLTTHGQLLRPGITGRFTYILHIGDDTINRSPTFGVTYGPSLRAVAEKLEAEYNAIGVTHARLTIWGPYYAENRRQTGPTESTCRVAVQQ